MGNIARFALTIGAIALFAGCGAQNTGTVPPGVGSQSRARNPSGSGDLLYVVTREQTDVLSYPRLKDVGTLYPKGDLGFVTTDSSTGNIFLDYGEVREYERGNPNAIATILPPLGIDYFDCAVDPTTGNIAVSADIPGTKNGGYVAVYSTPSGEPQTYSDPNLGQPQDLAYDSGGNLFVDSSGQTYLAELPKGASTFTDITLNEQPGYLENLQWDGSYMTVRSGRTIFRFTVSGSSGTIIGRTILKGAWDYNGTFWIQGDFVVGPHNSMFNGKRNPGRYLGFWNYPQGGEPFKVVKTLIQDKKNRIVGAAVSVAPSR